MSVATYFDEAATRSDGYRKAAAGSLARGPRGGGGGGGGGPYGVGTTEANPFEDSQLTSATRQYKAFRDHVSTAIRPVAVKIASLSFRCGTQKSRKERSRPAGPNAQFRAKAFANYMPEFAAKAMAEGMEQDDSHPLLDVFETPNPYMSGWAFAYCTAASIEITGRSYWWIIDTPQGELPLQLYYLPSTWVKAVHTEAGPYRGWRVKPPGMTEEEAEKRFGIIPFEDMCHFSYPDPADPLSSFSPMQAQAKAINTDNEIQSSQFATMVNQGKPGMVITVGRLEGMSGMTGLGPRPVLTAEQRQQLIQACRLAYSGAVHHGDPIIVDGMIEGVNPYTLTPAELDFLNSSQLTKDRIFQGIGTNPIIAGQIEGANRASAYVAQDNFYDMKVNPLGTLISQAATARLGTRFRGETGKRFYVWLDKAKAFDADLQVDQNGQLIEAESITKNELRESYGMAPLAKGGDEFASPPKPPLAPPGGSRPQSASRAAKKPPKK